MVPVQRKVKLIVSFIAMAIVIAALIVANVLCSVYYNIITMYICGFGLSEDTEQAIAARETGNKLAQQVVEEGAVLLKNDGVLPLEASSGTIKVNVFGWAGCDAGFIVQGSGSGTGSRNDLVTFLGGLKEGGIQYNEELIRAYDELGYRRIPGGYVVEAWTEADYRQFYGVVEAPESFYSADRISQARNYSDTAIIVLGRLLGEGNDFSKEQWVQGAANDPSRKLLSLSAREEYMIKQVSENFDKVIVVLNSANPMELGFVGDEKIDACLYMGYPGTRGTIGIANILTGKVNPSGHLTDTYAYDISTAASYATSGREGVGSYTDINGDTSLSTTLNKYSDYLEDIYVGYKWYETADAEGFWATDFAKSKWGIENGYSDVVQFPFGYGLSYTQFKWTVSGVNYESNASLPKNGKIEINLAVENVGDVAGKDVVELYYTPPYTKDGIEKSAVNLGAFAKTALLQPKQVEQLTITLPVEDMKSYDCYDKNNNGFMGYELEGGEYTITLRTDSHTLANVGGLGGTFKFRVPADGYKYETDTSTGTKVENRFTTYTNATSGASSTIYEPAVRRAHSIDGGEEPTKLTYVSRSSFVDTFPAEKPANRNAGQTLIDDTLYISVSPVNNSSDVAPAFGSKETAWTIQDVIGLEYDDPMWDELVSQLSLSVCAQLIAQGGFGTNSIPSIGKPATRDTDGPCGFNAVVTTASGVLKSVCYPSATVIGCTWDWYMAYQVGVAIGSEGNALGISGWYGPGANLHRSPMGGRNFEYFSEDGRLSGVMVGYEVYGAKERGVTAYVKHFAVNDVDSGRRGAYKWLTEQNLRENYLLPFELLVKVGKSNGMMTSFDRVGSTRASGSYALLTSVLREEWGFRGTVITDYFTSVGTGGSTNYQNDPDECIRAGNSQLLWTDGGLDKFDDTTSNTAKKAIFTSAKDILYSYVDTLNFAETAQGLEKGSTIGESVEVFAWWVIILVVIDVLSAALIGFWIFLLFRKKKPKQEPDAM